jgi:UDP-GlcNAc:undecaprenyl-phosphate GlcNAc-1-phosphate transferase
MLILTLMISALFGLGVAVLVGGNALRIGTALGVLDLPDGARKLHRRATPLVGGLAVAVAAAAGLLIAAGAASEPSLAWLAITVLAMFAVGLRDDRSHLLPIKRLAAAVAVFLPLLLVVPQFRLVDLHFAQVAQPLLLGGAFGTFFTILCLVGLLNAVNMADGKDGIVAGMALVWTGILAAYAPPMLWPALAATGAALAAIWGFNMAGKLFLGDSGSYAVSALFGLMAIFIYNAPGSTMLADDVALLFAVPVFDTIRLMVVRVAGGRSPFDPDRDHLHHHIHARIGWPMGLSIYLALVVAPNVAALLWRGSSLLWLSVTLVAYAAIIVAMRVSQPEGSPAE